MNFKLSCIALIATGAVSISSMAASTDDARSVHEIIPGKEKVKHLKSSKSRIDSLYYVQFKDNALSTYNGSVKGFSATSVNSQNKTQTGLLDTQSVPSRQYKNYLQTKQDSFVNKAKKLLKRNLKVKNNYKVLLNAITAELSPAEIKLLAKQPEVLSIEKVGMHYLHTSTGPKFIGAKNVWTGVSDHVGNQGEGVVVGILDTGISANHPSFASMGGDGYAHTNPRGKDNYLGDCQTYPKFCNDKLIGIVSFPEITEHRQPVVNENIDDLEDKLKIGYDFNGHGTHVSSTAAGNILHDINYYISVQDDIGSIYGESDFTFDTISGVAPHANLVSYQVCDYNGCYSDLSVLALEHAIENGVNVINYSVGGAARDPWTSIDSIAFLNARAAGIHVATSAGNSGADAATIGSPGNSPWITTVAAFTHNRGFTDKTLTAFSGGDTTPADITGKGATAAYTGNVVLASDYDDAQCLKPFDEGTFSGEIVVCERGTIARVRKGLNVKEGGAGGMILINLEDGAASVDADNHLLPAIHLNAQDGVTIVEWLETGSDHTTTISGTEMITDDELGDIAGVFTSRGPNLPYPNIFAPDIAGPGVNIYAAFAQDMPFTVDEGSVAYASLDGTSMSSPHVAGALALIFKAHPDWTPAQIQSAIMSTAHQVTYKDDDFDGVKERTTFFDQGAGSIRIDKALDAGLLLDISKAEYLAANPAPMDDDTPGDPSTLNSTSMVNSNCITSCSWTRTVEAVKDSSWTASYEYLNPGFTLVVSPSSFSLKAGEKQVLTITAASNINLEDEWVHGYINMDNADEAMTDTHLQATIRFAAGIVVEKVSGSLNNVTNEIVIEDVITSGTTELQAKGFGLFKAQDYHGQADGAFEGELNKIFLYPDTLFIKTVTVRPYTKRLIVQITESSSPDMDLYVGLDENLDGVPDASEMYYSLSCVSGQADSNEECVLDNPLPGEYWIFAHNYTGTTEGEADDVSMRVVQIGYTDDGDETFGIDAPESVAENELFDIKLTVNGYLDSIQVLTPLAKDEVYYGMLELGSKPTLKRNIGQTLIEVTGIEPVVVNLAPQVKAPIADIDVQLSSGGSADVRVDLSGVFSDPEEQALTYNVTGIEGFTVEGEILSSTVSTPGTYTVTVAVSDGEMESSTSFTLSVTPAPQAIEPPAAPQTKKSSGGSMGMVVFLLSGILMYRRRP